MYGPVPPVPVKFVIPLQLPKQVAFIVPVAVTTTGVGCVTVVVDVAVHPKASVTVTV